MPEHRLQLEALRDATNPRRLRQEIYDAIEQLFTLPDAVPGVAENVHLTLTTNRQNGGDGFLDLAFDRTPIKK